MKLPAKIGGLIAAALVLSLAMRVIAAPDSAPHALIQKTQQAKKDLAA